MADDRSEIAKRLAPYLDKGSDTPLYRQMVDRLWLDVITGSLDVGERLPTIRQLAVDLGVHPGSVERAYRELQMLGVFVVRPGGTFVALGSPDTPGIERTTQLERLCRDLLTQARAFGFSVPELVETLRDQAADSHTWSEEGHDE
jgi:DNA-binding transcriptional regulator YhcF (GntR family)